MNTQRQSQHAKEALQYPADRCPGKNGPVTLLHWQSSRQYNKIYSKRHHNIQKQPQTAVGAPFLLLCMKESCKHCWHVTKTAAELELLIDISFPLLGASVSSPQPTIANESPHWKEGSAPLPSKKERARCNRLCRWLAFCTASELQKIDLYSEKCSKYSLHVVLLSFLLIFAEIWP